MRLVSRNRLVSLIYNHNPFYLISAALVLFAIHSSIVPGATTAIDPWLLTGLFVGYTTLMACTAFLIVRFGQVWDDARSIFMVLLLLFLALSVSFDHLCLPSPSMAAVMLSLGFGFAVIVTEALVWSLKIKFTAWFRIPYYSMLGLCFCFPLIMAGHNLFFAEIDPRWVLAGFPIAASATILLLLPAVRRGSAYVAKNGTPWCWPWYPYSVFVMLAAGLVGRSCLLNLAFEPSAGMQSAFGLYFLVPMFIAAMIVVLEIAITQRLVWLQRMSIVTALAALVLALPWKNDPVYLDFLSQLSLTVASPLWLTAMGLVAFYCVTMWRKRWGAEACLSIVLATLTFIDPRANTGFAIDVANSWPLLGLAVLQVVNEPRRKCSRRIFIAALLVSTAGVIELGRWFAPGLAFVAAAHFLLLSVIGVGGTKTDRFALQLRIMGAFMLPIYALAAGILAITETVPSWAAMLEIGLLGTIGLTVWKTMPERVYFYSVAATLFLGQIPVVLFLHQQLRQDTLLAKHQKMIELMAFGLVCFAIGVVISSLKAGMLKRLRTEINRTIIDIEFRFHLLNQPQKPS